jgi:transcriptional regulator with XRE-family HTH domain
MKREVKKNISQVELVRTAMQSRGWSAADLSRASGVSTGVLSRFFHDDGMSADNLFAVLASLDLLTGRDSPPPYPYRDENREIHDLVEYVLQSGKVDAVNAFKAGLGGVLMFISDRSETAKAIANIEKLLRKLISERTEAKSSKRKTDHREKRAAK